MKLSLLLALFCLTFLARSQLPTNGSSWTVTDANLNTVLGHPNEACWPNGTVTLFYNRSGYTFTATNWSGPACSEYNLTAQTTFSLPNDNFFGYVNSNQSVQFNFGLINSTNMMINLWYGCVGVLDCDTTATVYLSIVSACSFSINSVPFNTCPLAANNLYFNVTANIEGYIIMSLGAPSVLNCAGDQYIWAVLHNKNGSTCHDIATQNPSYSMQYESDPEQGGLLLTFPVQQAENETASFQLVIDLDCYPSVWNPLDHSLSMQGFNMNGTTNLTTINLWGFSGYGCVQSKNSCPPVIIGGNVYACNACLLNQTIYNISDSYGGVLSFNLGDTPIVQNCPGQSPAIVYGIYNTNTGKCIVASSEFNEPAYQALNQSNPNQGLQISMGEGVSYNTGGVSDTYVTLNLLCDANQTDLLLLNPPMILSQLSSGALALQINGTSPYACPINSSTTNTIIV